MYECLKFKHEVIKIDVIKHRMKQEKYSTGEKGGK